jgi:thiol-disulfide isomerase/thioredoxin
MGLWWAGFLRLTVATVCLSSSGMFAQGIDLGGRVVDPIAAGGGKPVVLIFVRTDCPISHRYAPEIRRLGEKYAAKAEFWLVFPSKSDSADVIAKDVKDFDYKLRALSDPKQALVKKANAIITPEAAVFDPKGALVYHGRIDDWSVAFGRAKHRPTTHDLDEAVQAVIDGRAVARSETKAVGCYISDLR